MPDETYSVPENPGFPIDSIRMILNTDPVNAEDIITPLVESLLELAAYLKKHKADLGEDGKVPGNQLPEIDLSAKQDTLTGVQGQVVGFNAAGKAVPQNAPETGVTSFNGRKNAVTPQNGDYTAGMVGALPIAGGTLTGPLTIGKMKLTWNASTASLDFEVLC